ncbi:TadE/TadG family type IV pilus assembly protein [Celeribacter sp.]|uniref:TadE/TadG family type IV pilus assembly protein n=1 Tax=Celeribacter sp. TaxID=1890673 RepID=UPI003A917145
MSILSRLTRRLRRHRRDEEGSATVEFALIFPAFAMLLMGGYEVGYYAVSSTMMQRGLDLAVRDIRLGAMPTVTPENVRLSICTYARFVRGCSDNIHIILEPVDARNFDMPNKTGECIDRASNTIPDTIFQDGGENELMLVRACMNVSPVLPLATISSRLEKSSGSGYQMYATAAFVNEPNT